MNCDYLMVHYGELSTKGNNKKAFIQCLTHNVRHALKGLDCRVNLIRFHAIPGANLKSSDPRSMEAFRDRLNQHGVTATIRASRGEDIFAACGMLSTAEKERK